VTINQSSSPTAGGTNEYLVLVAYCRNYTVAKNFSEDKERLNNGKWEDLNFETQFLTERLNLILSLEGPCLYQSNLHAANQNAVGGLLLGGFPSLVSSSHRV
jgi:hypothetical protein